MKIIEFGHVNFMVLLLSKMLVEAKARLGSIFTTSSFSFSDLSITFRADVCCIWSFLSILFNTMENTMYYEAINLA